MKDTSKTDWQWPQELDALIASPQHHRLLYENEFVRVIDTFIPQGEITAIHTHQWPASLYVLSWAHFIRYDAAGNVMLDSRSITNPPPPASAVWAKPLEPHALRNIGDRDIHIISTEIKS